MPRFRIDGIALSVNKCWQGKRFKSKDYKQYEEKLLWLLPRFEMPEPPYILKLEIGFSNKRSDLDNINKPFQDILSTKYKFNDREIYRIILDKKIVAKGKEYITFEIKTLETDIATN